SSPRPGKEEYGIPGVCVSGAALDGLVYRDRSVKDEQGAVKIPRRQQLPGRRETQDPGCMDRTCGPRGRASADDQAQIRAVALRDCTVRLPVSLEAGAPPRRVEEALAVSPEPKLQTLPGDQSEGPAVARIGREVTVLRDVGETQAPGEFLTRRRLAGDLECRASAVAPRHGAIAFVSEDLNCHLRARLQCLRDAWAQRIDFVVAARGP